jgi:RsiW-degrading membrane proteinase PrsW (M82 family)
MIQLTNTKQDEFMDKHNRLSTNAKNLLSTITMGAGFTAADRYQYLVNFTL